MLHVTNGDSAGEHQGRRRGRRDHVVAGRPARGPAAGRPRRRGAARRASALPGRVRLGHRPRRSRPGCGRATTAWPPPCARARRSSCGSSTTSSTSSSCCRSSTCSTAPPGVETVLTDRHLTYIDPAWLAQLFSRREPVEPAQVDARRAPPGRPSALPSRRPVRGAAGHPHGRAAAPRPGSAPPARGAPGDRRRALAHRAPGARRARRRCVGADGDPRTRARAAEDAAFLGDTWLWRRLAELGGGEHPLVQGRGGEPVGPAPPVSTDGGLRPRRARAHRRRALGPGRRGRPCSARPARPLGRGHPRLGPAPGLALGPRRRARRTRLTMSISADLVRVEGEGRHRAGRRHRRTRPWPSTCSA